MTEYEMFEGIIEITIEAETHEEAKKILNEITHQIINQRSKSVYRAKYTALARDEQP